MQLQKRPMYHKIFKILNLQKNLFVDSDKMSETAAAVAEQIEIKQMCMFAC